MNKTNYAHSLVSIYNVYFMSATKKNNFNKCVSKTDTRHTRGAIKTMCSTLYTPHFNGNITVAYCMTPPTRLKRSRMMTPPNLTSVSYDLLPLTSWPQSQPGDTYATLY